MKRTGTVLIVDDEENMRRVLGALLRREGFAFVEACDGERALEALDQHDVDAVLTDLKMPHMNGLEFLEQSQKRHPDLPVVLLTAHGTVGSAVEALKHGAFDFLTKPFDPQEVQDTLRKAVETHRLAAREASVRHEEDPDDLLVGTSTALAEVKHVIERVAETPATVLISGESGTGKELVARSLHHKSDRADRPFVKINCAAIPDGLIESELFGYEKGAFTGAASHKPGRFELADGGTLFLDEIGEMPLSAQPKLLRAIQEGRFYRVGGTATVEVDVRLVAATNRDLCEEVRRGRFREDLYYRIHVVPLRLPALRERRGDIPALAALFLERFARRNDRAVRAISPEAVEVLRAQDWPGNIRELENLIERATLLCDGTCLRPEDLRSGGGLPGLIARPGAERVPGSRTGDTDADPDSGSARLPLRDRIRSATRRIERDAIAEALEQTDGNVTRAARQLGLSRRGLQLKMRELGIARATHD